jgi:hypothetical protein
VWYIRIVYYLISVCVTNAWLIYKINNKGNKMALREFTLAVSDSLMRCGKNTKAGRPTLQRNINIDNLTKAEKNAYKKIKPSEDIRYDSVGHWAVCETKRNRCKYCENQMLTNTKKQKM